MISKKLEFTYIHNEEIQKAAYLFSHSLFLCPVLELITNNSKNFFNKEK